MKEVLAVVSEQRMARMAELLSQQAELYRGLLGLAEEKRKSLIAGNVKDLDRLLEAEQVLFWRAGRMDEEVSGLLDQIASDLGLEHKPRLEQLASLLDETGGERCSELVAALDTVLLQLAELNRTNSQLITDMLAQVESSLRMLTAFSSDGVYSATGEQHAETMSRLVNSQV